MTPCQLHNFLTFNESVTVNDEVEGIVMTYCRAPSQHLLVRTGENQEKSQVVTPGLQVKN
jgi:hypothetical protein